MYFTKVSIYCSWKLIWAFSALIAPSPLPGSLQPPPQVSSARRPPLQPCTPGPHGWPGTTVDRGAGGVWTCEVGVHLCACRAPRSAEWGKEGEWEEGGRLRVRELWVASSKSKLGLESCYEDIYICQVGGQNVLAQSVNLI